MQQTLKQEKSLNTQQDILKLENLYSNGDLFLQDYLITHTLLNQETTKPCFSHYQNSNVGNSWKVIGILKKVQRLLSLIGIYMLLNPIKYLAIGLSSGLVIMVMGLIQVLYGLLYRPLNNWLFTGNYTYLKF